LEPFLLRHINQDHTYYSLEKVLKALGLPREAKYYAGELAAKGSHFIDPNIQPSARVWKSEDSISDDGSYDDGGDEE
jgi:hypothetical protein